MCRHGDQGEQNHSTARLSCVSQVHVDVGHIEIGTCWIPGPEGNRILPDFMAVHVTNLKMDIDMRYYMEQEVFGFGSHVIGGGAIRTTVVGALMLNHISLSDFNNTIRDCKGLLTPVETKISGLLTLEEYPDDPQADEQLIHDICYGPTYWDFAFGPRPIGLVEEVNREIRRRFWEDYVAPPPSPPPPFWCDCSWTATFTCPHAPLLPSAKAFAVDDGSPCFHFCCVEHHFHEAIDAYYYGGEPPAGGSYFDEQVALHGKNVPA